jgi:two-component system LytT family sensor kinase
LAKQPFSDQPFRGAFITTAGVVLVTDVLLLYYWYKFSFELALADGMIHTLLLVIAAMAIVFNLKYYRPAAWKYLYVFFLSISLSVLWACLSLRMCSSLFPGELIYKAWLHYAIPVRVIIGTLFLTGMGMNCLVWYGMDAQQEELERKDTVEKMSKDAELYKLRQQLQPHFLFNSLNSINALITLRPQQAREMVLKLSDFLRGSLKREDEHWISLPEELQYLEWYLDIEKVRFGHRLSTHVVSDEAARKMFIPPMLLQPVVENAIKYGLYDTTEAITISIRAWVQEDILYLEVQNPFDAALQQPNKGTGFGLTSIRRRLYLLFARQDLLETIVSGNIYTTLIKVPQTNDKSNNN